VDGDSKVSVYQDCPDLHLRLVAREHQRGKLVRIFIPADCSYSPLCYPCLIRRRDREQQLDHNGNR